LEEKIQNFIDNPSTLLASNSHGVKKYLKEQILDNKTGEFSKDFKKNVYLDLEKYKRDVEMDGYYSIITND
jgi:hypothetical protein